MDRIKAGPKYLGRFKTLTPRQFIQASKIVNSTWEDRSKKYAMGRAEEDCKELKLLYEAIKKEDQKKLKHNTYFWWSLAVDQMFHFMVQYGIIFVLVMDKAL